MFILKDPVLVIRQLFLTSSADALVFGSSQCVLPSLPSCPKSFLVPESSVVTYGPYEWLTGNLQLTCRVLEGDWSYSTPLSLPPTFLPHSYLHLSFLSFINSPSLLVFISSLLSPFLRLSFLLSIYLSIPPSLLQFAPISFYSFICLSVPPSILYQRDLIPAHCPISIFCLSPLMVDLNRHGCVLD